MSTGMVSRYLFVIYISVICYATEQGSAACPARCICSNTMVDCTSLSLTAAPDAIPTNTTYLDLDTNKITDLTNAFHGLSNLKKLELQYNQITSVTGVFRGLSKLEELYIYKNQITSLEGVFEGLSNLRILSSSHNQLTDLTNVFTGLSNLEEVRLGNNQITDITGVFNGLTKLRILFLENNKITDINGVFQGLSNLQVLDLKNNPISCNCKMAEELRSIKIIFGSCTENDSGVVYKISDIVNGTSKLDYSCGAGSGSGSVVHRFGWTIMSLMLITFFLV